MSGFYLHIPFCRQACRYCDFHFSVSLKYKASVVEAMIREIEARKEEFKDQEFNSLYFGGGTPSVLTKQELSDLCDVIHKNYRFSKNIEFTLEANPDDLKEEYLKDLKGIGVNRLSIGIQSFREQDLQLMRRSHNSVQAEQSIKDSQNIGITNINVDLIYGVPGMSSEVWMDNLDKVFLLGIKHLSAYHLTFETGTIFDHWRKKGRIIPVDEETGLEQFSLLRKRASENDFLHYEISNFALEGYLSKHNTGYWKQVPYIGIGPSAHSYSGNSRRWNISSNKKYISSLLQNEGNYYEVEILSLTDLYNEYIITSLRTIWGLDLEEIRQRFGNNYVKYTEDSAKKFLDGGELEKNENIIRLTEKGIFLADYILRELYIEGNHG